MIYDATISHSVTLYFDAIRRPLSQTAHIRSKCFLQHNYLV